MRGAAISRKTLPPAQSPASRSWRRDHYSAATAGRASTGGSVTAREGEHPPPAPLCTPAPPGDGVFPPLCVSTGEDEGGGQAGDPGFRPTPE